MKTLNKTTKKFYDVKTRFGKTVKVVLEIETRDNNKGELVLSISGALYDTYKYVNGYRKDPIAFGQVDMDIDYEAASDDLKRILDIWKEYHLNDMHAECIHQEEAGIRKLASQPLYKVEYTMTHDTIVKQRGVEDFIKKELTQNGTVALSQDQRELYTMKYSIKKFFLNADEAKENIPEGYKLREVEATLRGHTSLSESEFGLLGKECPVCGYKYGHGWTYRPIPEEILTELGLK
jgi:hypothetical protein